MTREQIMALEGEALNAAVGERLMGWRLTSVYVWDGKGRHEEFRRYSHPRMDHDAVMPDFGGDIAAAWRVVEHIEQPIVLTNVAVGKWACTVMMFETDEDDITVQCDTAPEAICKAALLAHFTDVRAAKNGGVES